MVLSSVEGGGSLPPVIMAAPAPSPVPDWLQILVAGGSALSSIGVLVALATFFVQLRKNRQERADRDKQLAELQRAEKDRIAAQARKVVPEIAKSVLFGNDDIWMAHVQNASAGAINNLKVVVAAFDGNNQEVPDGFVKATGKLDISGSFQRIISDAFSGSIGGALGGRLGGAMDPNPFAGLLGQQFAPQNQYRDMLAQQITPQVSKAIQQAMLGQMQKDWPPSLGPNASVTVAYRVTRPDLRLQIGIGFEDEAGYEWERVNQNQPTLVERDQNQSS